MAAKQPFHLAILGFLLLAYISVQVYCINQLSLSYDEGSFAAYGATILKFQRQKDIVAFESKLPITALNMIPRAVEQLLSPGLVKTWPASQSDIINGRYVSLLFAVVLGLLIFTWTKRLYNTPTALFVFATFLLCPNFLAHGVFVSSDIFACFFMTAAFYFLWVYYQDQRFKYFLLMCVATGLAEISKFSMVHLLLLIPCLIVAQFIYNRRLPEGKPISFRRTIVYLLLFFGLNWLIICTAHFFYQMFVPINSYHFKSMGFKTVQSFFNRTAPWFPIPLPSSYIASMDAVMYFDRLGGGVQESLNGEPYLLGQSSSKGFWYYYFVVLFFKLPIALLVLWLASFVFFVLKFSKKTFFKNDLFLLLPVMYFLIYMSFFYSTQVGIRHLLIIFPLLFVLSGRIVYQTLTTKTKWMWGVIIGYQAVSVLSYFPHFLPYTNEFILNKKLAYRKIADTNLCYGEGKKFLNEFLARHPGVVYMPEQPRAGKVLLEVNEMLNLDIATVHKYDWASSLVPVDHIHSQYLLFDVKESDLDSIKRLHGL